MYADVIVDIVHSDVDRVFEYSFEEGDGVVAGSRVAVPFGNKTIEGIVIKVKENSDYDSSKIKPIVRLLDGVNVLTSETLSLMHFICKKYYCAKAQALRLFLPSEMRKGRVKEQTVKIIFLSNGLDVEDAINSCRKSAQKQIELLRFLSSGEPANFTSLCKKFGNSAVNALLKKGWLKETICKTNRTPFASLEAKDKSVTLTQKQLEAVESFNSTDKRVSLLFGVTGSGKTEVYLELIERTIAQGKTAVMLVPEISLTPQMFSQLKARFSSKVAILHSGLSAGERFDEWWRLRNGEAVIAVGARSAMFAPLENLGLIVVDEEHDGSYQSESAPRYSTFEVACKRAELSGAKVIIGSATPSIDSYRRAISGEFNLIELPDRINKRPLPFVEIADMRKEIRRGNNSFFSSVLKDELSSCLESGNQAIIFLNRRGYSKTVICTECGHVQKCDSCDVSLTYHKEDDSLLCHYCGIKYKMIPACTECGSTRLQYGGIGTERVVDELSKLFPKARILRMDRDTTQSKERHYKILSEFGKHNADILVGTQMIAKGHDFPSVTLVGILDADASLYFSDYRSSERTFQLITQVAGRSGRAQTPGKVVLQTYQPENAILRQALNYDYKSFFTQELSLRKATAFPPFADIVRVLVSGEDEEKTLNQTRLIFEKLNLVYQQNREFFKFFGCMKAPLKRLQNKYRFQILIRLTPEGDKFKDSIYQTSASFRTRDVNVSFEINPNNLT